jgi:NHLM bacteriocin system ABC transporter ATP-binding protein
MSNLRDITGESVGGGGHRPFPLAGNAVAWIVKAGSIDVFSVPMATSDAGGPRRHLCRVEPGGVLFGLDPSSGAGSGLLAVGTSDAELTRTSAASLFSAAPEESRRRLEEWVDSLAVVLHPELAPKECVRLRPDNIVDAPDGACHSSGDDFIWVRQLEGRSLICGREQLPLTADRAPWYPLPRALWIRADGAGRLQASSTGALTTADQVIDGLAAFHATVQASLDRDEALAEAARQDHLRAKVDSARGVFEGALWKLASVIREEPPETIATTDLPLVKACRKVADALGIELVVPPDIAAGREGNDPVTAIAAASRFRTRQVLLGDRWWTQDNGAMLAFDGPEGSPVALLPASPRRYRLYDPATGRTTRVNAAVAARLQPTAHHFYRPLPDTRLDLGMLIRHGLFGIRRDLLTVVLMGMAGGLLGALIPIFTGILFDSVIPGANRGQLWHVGAALLTGALAGAVFEITKAVAILRIEGKMDASLQTAIMSRLLALPATFFRGFTSGDLAIRAMSINTMRMALSGPIATSLLAFVFSGFSYVLLFVYSPELAWIATLLIVAYLVVVLLFTLRGLIRQRQVYDLDGRISGMLLQYITGVAKLKVSGSERRAFANWADLFSRKRELDFQVRKLTDLKLSILSVYPIICSMVLFWAVRRTSGLTTGAFLAFTAAFAQFMAASLEIGQILLAVVGVIPLYKRTKPILHALPEVSRAKSDPGTLTGSIDVSRVYFKYAPDGPEILRDVSLRIEPGEFVAVVGSSGSGKSTLFRILLGFEIPAQGAVYFDGQDLADLDVRAVRRQMGVVLQAGQLMAGDIYSNIVGASNLTVDDAWKAAAMAGLDKDIRQMPMGMHTVVPAGGGTLSGGQRQRLMIARAIVNRPRIVLFDEATSALDNHTQAVVGQSLASLHATRVVIAHRLSTIINADRIFVLEKGIVVQSGTYRELMDQEGPFVEIAKRQLA